ncbi:hypothetical protein ACET3X_003345 [Alternaria dauci]|uniref:Uncharacterized protein n=1 Tax=Alternaria dauci TaxID=48095 RepID=A0ABR3US54_9PLEO
MMFRRTLIAQFLLSVRLVASFAIKTPPLLEARDTLETRATDPRDEVVYLADCKKYKDKESDQQDILEHLSLALYHDTYDYTVKNASFSWQDVATASYPEGQRIDSMGGAFVEWTAGKQDDRIEANFAKLERRFWVHGLSADGDSMTKATGVASLGDHDMRCYKTAALANFPRNKWYYRCKAEYACTRQQRQIRRTLVSINEETVEVRIVGRNPKKLKGAEKNEPDARVSGVIDYPFYWMGLLNPDEGSIAEETVIDKEIKRHSTSEYHSARVNWVAGQKSTDPTYNPRLIKDVSELLRTTLVPEIEKKVKGAGPAFWDNELYIFKALFPASIKIQVQIAFQEQLDWKNTDVIDLTIVSHEEGSCGEGAAWAKLLSGLFAGAAAVATGGASAVLSALGGISGAVHTVACLEV